MSDFTNEWRLEDITDQMQGTPALSVISYFDELDEEDEVCSLFLNDVNAASQVRNAILIKNLPNILTLLRELEPVMGKQERKEYQRILKETKNGNL